VARVAAVEGLVGGAVKLVDLSNGWGEDRDRPDGGATRLRARLAQRLGDQQRVGWREAPHPGAGHAVVTWPGSARRLGGILE
jgi:hypothetical protein